MRRLQSILLAAGLAVGAASAFAATPGLRYADQGTEWTPSKRLLFYDVDQGSQLIPLAVHQNHQDAIKGERYTSILQITGLVPGETDPNEITEQED